MGVAMTRRLYYIDWLRVLAVLLLFPFHTSRIFNALDPFYLKSPYISSALNYFLGFLDHWHMPLLFALAGASTYFALRTRGIGQYAIERVKRLLVPLVFGFLVLIPPQTYIGARYNSGYTRSFWQYLTSGDFLRWNVGEAGDYYGGFGIGHLWFILFLFVGSMLLLPVLAWARGERGHAALSRFARRLSKPVWWILVAVILFLTEGLIPEIGGKNLVWYFVFFFLGFVVMHDDSFMEAAGRAGWLHLGLGLAIAIGYVLTWEVRESLPDPSWGLTGMNLVGQLGIWLAIVGFLGVGTRHLDRPSPALSYLAEASYPLYILHQTVIVVAAWFAVSLPGPWALQWIALFVVALLSTFGLYEVVRRIPPLRFLFGMKGRA